MDLLSELLRRTDFRVEEPRVHRLGGAWAIELPATPLVLLVLRGRCTGWLEGERHSRTLSDGHLLLISGARRCTLQAPGPKLAAAGPFVPAAGAPLTEPIFFNRAEGHLQLLAAEIRWRAREGDQLLLPDWLVMGPNALSLTHQRRILHEALAEELQAPRPGRIAEVQRLLEAMAIRSLRVEVMAGFWSVSGWLGALTDPVIRTGLNEAPDLSSVESVRALAAQAHCSPRRLGARIRRISGTRPGRLLRQLHLAGVLEALEHPVPRLDEIARGAGYSNVSSFCRAFRREIGCSPAVYWRRRHRRPFPRESP